MPNLWFVSFVVDFFIRAYSRIFEADSSPSVMIIPMKALDIDPKKRYTGIMIFPIEELIEYKENMYEITAAASRRSFQLSMLRDPDIYDVDGKVVSLAAQQVFTKEVEFRLEAP
jgi:DNA-directed RNA polymerase subunit omega